LLSFFSIALPWLSGTVLSLSSRDMHSFFIRHEFYETDEKVTLSIFDRGANPDEVQVKFEDRKVGLVDMFATSLIFL
jgi:hypothetical protein